MAMPTATAASRAGSPWRPGSSGSMTSIEIPMTVAFASVPRPGRWCSGIQVSSTRKETITVIVPTAMPVCLPAPWASTVHGELPSAAATSSASPIPKTQSALSSAASRAGPGRRRLRGSDRAAAGKRAPERDLVGVLEVAAHRQPGGEARDRDVRRARVQLGGDVQRRGLAGGRRVRGQHALAELAAPRPGVELSEPQVLRLDAVDRRERPAEHVVAAAELVRALDRDHVAGLLDHADHGAVAPLVQADRAAGALGEVEADLAQRDLLLDVLDRLGQRERVVGGGAQDVEGEPLRGAVADPGQLGELADEALEGRGEHYGRMIISSSATGGAPARRPRGPRPAPPP